MKGYSLEAQRAAERRDTAVRLLQHYLEYAFRAGGLKWTADNDVEVEQLVDDLIGAARA